MGASAAWSFRNLKELAKLVFDSDVDGLVGVRGHGPRQLSFRTSGATIDLEVAGTVRVHALGQLVPGRPHLVEFVQDTGTSVAVADHAVVVSSAAG